MSNFDLNKYATVDERIHAFYKKFEDGRILTKRVTEDPEGNVEIFKAYLYRTPAEQERNLPLSTGYAQEVRDEELQISKQGYEYASVNYTAWLENCETSAIGRALANAGFTGNKNRPSREEMEKVKRTEEKATGQKKKSPAKQAEDRQDEQPESTDDSESDSEDNGIQSKIDSAGSVKELIAWWKDQMDRFENDSDEKREFLDAWQPKFAARLEELKKLK